MNFNFARKVNYQGTLMMKLSIITTNQQFVSILHFEAYNKIICGFANSFQKPNFLVHKYIQDQALKG